MRKRFASVGARTVLRLLTVGALRCRLLAFAVNSVLASLAAQPYVCAADAVVTFEDVISQVRAAKPPAEILQNCDVVFTLTPEEITKLVQVGAPQSLISALQTQRISIGDVTDFIVILDCSGSMKDLIGPSLTKMDAAKKVVGDLFQAIPDGRNVAFIVYGHDIASECRAVSTLRALEPIDRESRSLLAASLKGLKPVGSTPIAGSIKAAGELLAKSEGMSQLVLITDGVETCHGDPAAEAESLASRTKNLRAVEVIGVGLKTNAEKKAVSQIAHRGRGKFYDTDSIADLRNAVAATTDVKAIADNPAKLPSQLSATEQAFVKQLGDSSSAVRKAAAEALGKRGNKAAEIAQALENRISDNVWNDRDSYDINFGNYNSKDAALEALKKLAANRVETALLKASTAKSTDIKVWATSRLGAVKDSQTEADENPTEETKPSSVAESALSPVESAHVKNLKDSTSAVRKAAAEALGKSKNRSPKLIDALVNRVSDSVWNDRDGYDLHNGDYTSKDAALAALKKLDPDRVEAALVKAMESKVTEVKVWATKRLTP